jgi:hypothetical protein
MAIILPPVRNQTAGAILDPIFRVAKITATLIPQGIQRAKAEQTIKILRVRTLMAGKILTLPVLKKVVIGHLKPPSRDKPPPVLWKMSSFPPFSDAENANDKTTAQFRRGHPAPHISALPPAASSGLQTAPGSDGCAR